MATVWIVEDGSSAPVFGILYACWPDGGIHHKEKGRTSDGRARFPLSPSDGERVGVRGEAAPLFPRLNLRPIMKTPHPGPPPVQRGEGIHAPVQSIPRFLQYS